ncbi:MAG: hypothetical protein QOH10_2921, partial [Actinomycetota bacterium]|nr:hypothetical protein [Actinomycetota bacterium]
TAKNAAGPGCSSSSRDGRGLSLAPAAALGAQASELGEIVRTVRRRVVVRRGRRGRGLVRILTEEEAGLDVARERMFGAHAARRCDENHQQRNQRRAHDQSDEERQHAEIVLNGNMGSRAARTGAIRPGPSGGMADTTDSKSVARKGVRVQIPPRAPI